MSGQQQPRRPTDEHSAVTYGDVFDVSGELASKPIAPQDAAMMQAAETRVYGQTPKGRPAAAMQQAATANERAGLVAHTDVSDPAADQGFTIMETDVSGTRYFTESVGGQVVAQYTEPEGQSGGGTQAPSAITIGEALEASAYAARDKPVDWSDAAAIQAAEVRASGTNVMTPGGLAASAQSAASSNAQVGRDGHKIKLGDVLTKATTKLPADRAVTPQDAEGVVSAELRNDPDIRTHPGGVAASITAAARINQRGNQ